MVPKQSWAPSSLGTVTGLRGDLNYGRPRSPRSESFAEDVRDFSKNFVSVTGREGMSFYDPRIREHRHGLKEMVDAFLYTEGKGEHYWPDDATSPRYNSLEFLINEDKINDGLQKLFAKTNFNSAQNQKYRKTNSPVVVKSKAGKHQQRQQGSSDDPIDLGHGRDKTSFPLAISRGRRARRSRAPYTRYRSRNSSLHSSKASTTEPPISRGDMYDGPSSTSPSVDFLQEATVNAGSGPHTSEGGAQTQMNGTSTDTSRADAQGIPSASVTNATGAVGGSVTSGAMSTRWERRYANMIRMRPSTRRIVTRHDPSLATEEEMGEAMRTPCSSISERSALAAPSPEPVMAALGQERATAAVLKSDGSPRHEADPRSPFSDNGVEQHAQHHADIEEQSGEEPRAQSSRLPLRQTETVPPHDAEQDTRLLQQAETESWGSDVQAPRSATIRASPCPFTNAAATSIQATTPCTLAGRQEPVVPQLPARRPWPVVEVEYEVVHSRTPVWHATPWKPDGTFMEKTLRQLEDELPLEYATDAEGLLFTILSDVMNQAYQVRRGDEAAFKLMKRKLMFALAGFAKPNVTIKLYLAVEATQSDDNSQMNNIIKPGDIVF